MSEWRWGRGREEERNGAGGEEDVGGDADAVRTADGKVVMLAVVKQVEMLNAGPSVRRRSGWAAAHWEAAVRSLVLRQKRLKETEKEVGVVVSNDPDGDADGAGDDPDGDETYGPDG